MGANNAVGLELPKPGNGVEALVALYYVVGPLFSEESVYFEVYILAYPKRFSFA